MPVTRIVGRSDGTGVGDAFPGGFPVVAKPRTGFESRGVTVVESRAGLARLPFVVELAVNAVLHGVPGRGFAPPLSHHESLGVVRIAVTDLHPAGWRDRLTIRTRAEATECSSLTRSPLTGACATAPARQDGLGGVRNGSLLHPVRQGQQVWRSVDRAVGPEAPTRALRTWAARY
ncbi:hypothetical protein [Streptomyces sp. H27-C3]|uniref:hypothetical protein n=1 Tax=Streptomyces sp. H27-C3 TaxID=3046305 RepID=UPI0024B8CC54|nr:hypothetical protein [Streptomyces sp. H27-C3]MDJ0463231.1 hypothetical protein [Streptomyces sp. H27-C3]